MRMARVQSCNKLATNGSRRLASPPRRRQLLLQLADQQTREAARGAPRPRQRRRQIHRNGPCVGVAVQLRLPAIASAADGRRWPDVPRRPAPPAAAREPSRPGRRRFRQLGAGAGAVAVARLVAEDGSLRGRDQQAAPSTPAGVAELFASRWSPRRGDPREGRRAQGEHAQAAVFPEMREAAQVDVVQVLGALVSEDSEMHLE